MRENDKKIILGLSIVVILFWLFSFSQQKEVSY